MIQKTMTIKIASKDTPLAGGGKSMTGHMWYEIDDGYGNKNSFGFAPDLNHAGEPFTPYGDIYVSAP